MSGCRNPPTSSGNGPPSICRCVANLRQGDRRQLTGIARAVRDDAARPMPRAARTPFATFLGGPAGNFELAGELRQCWISRISRRASYPRSYPRRYGSGVIHSARSSHRELHIENAATDTGKLDVRFGKEGNAWAAARGTDLSRALSSGFTREFVRRPPTGFSSTAIVASPMALPGPPPGPPSWTRGVPVRCRTAQR